MIHCLMVHLLAVHGVARPRGRPGARGGAAARLPRAGPGEGRHHLPRRPRVPADPGADVRSTQADLPQRGISVRHLMVDRSMVLHLGDFKNPRSGKGQETSEPIWTRPRLRWSKKLHKIQHCHPKFETSRCTFAERSGKPSGSQSISECWKCIHPQ